jgi:uncharacterized membrane protein YidH (DUF202 family)
MKTSNVKKNLLGIAIAIIFVLFVGYGINTFYDDPSYDDYCEEGFFAVPKPVAREQPTCSTIQPTDLEYKDCRDRKGDIMFDYDSEGCPISYECSLCRHDYDTARNNYNRIVFIISGIIGLIAIIIGGIVLKVESVDSGIMGGGILTVIYGTLRYWGNLEDIFRFLILGIVLAVLIWMGYKKLK